MLTTITIDYKFRNKLCLLFKNKKYSEEAIKKANKLHENAVELFRDINGQAYVGCHGSEYVMNGKIYGFLNYNGDSMTYPEKVYEDLVKRGFICNGETVNIICCYGAGVKECYDRRCRDGYCKKYPIMFVNDTHTVCYTTIIKLRNGNIRYIAATQNNEKEKREFRKALFI